MKKKFLFLSLILAVLVSIPAFLTGCGTKCAWVALKVDSGYVYYTSYKYPTSHSHIVLWESEEEAQEEYANPSMEITFYPCIMAPDTVNEEKATIVDLSQRYHDMNVVIYKDSSIYDANKSIYLNGKKLVADPSYTSDYDNLVSYMFTDYEISAGTSDKINYIEYK